MDVIGSAPERPLRRARWRRPGWRALPVRPGRLPSTRRRGVLGLAAVLGAGALLTLRSVAEPVPSATPDRRAVATGEASADFGPQLRPPPFDRLPGRTRIPAPTRVGSSLGGTLPAVGGPGKAAAVRSAELVLGRFCREPSRYTVAVGGGPDWRSATASVFQLERSYAPAAVVLRLEWTGRAYQWRGSPVQLGSC
jgi:hypothetical protein